MVKYLTHFNQKVIIFILPLLLFPLDLRNTIYIMSCQLNIARLTKPNSCVPKFTSSLNHNSIRCACCGHRFTSKGYASHIKLHQLDLNTQQVTLSKPRHVIVCGMPYNDQAISSNEDSDSDGGEGIVIEELILMRMQMTMSLTLKNQMARRMLMVTLRKMHQNFGLVGKIACRESSVKISASNYA